MTIICIAGVGGSGKTMLGVILTTALKEDGFKVCTNVLSYKYIDYNLEKDFNKIITERGKYLKDDRAKLDKIIVLFDEVQQYLDSRESISVRNRKLTQKLFQIRKYRMDLIYTLQDYRSVDVRLRRITEYIILPKYNEENNELYFAVLNNNDMFLYDKRLYVNPKVYDLYDTFEDIEGEIDLNQNADKINKKLRNIGKLSDI